jgi:hypothetical protein
MRHRRRTSRTSVDFTKRLQSAGSTVYTQRVSDTVEPQNDSSSLELLVGPPSNDDPFIAGRCRIRSGKLEVKKTAAAVAATFLRRATHKIASTLEPPPGEWAGVFNAFAKECGLAMKMEEGFALVRDFMKALKP